MGDVKRTLAHLAILYLLFAVNIFLTSGFFPHVFPFTDISSIYLIILSVCLLLRYYLRVTGSDQLKSTMLWLAGMILLLIVLRCIKYSVFGRNSVQGRYIWYLFYVPLVMIPTLFFYASCFVFTENGSLVRRKWGWVAGISILLSLMVITNDLHQQVFRFAPGFINWDSRYTYGVVYYIAVFWQFLLYTAAVTVLLVRSSLAKIEKRAWLIMIPFMLGVSMLCFLAAGKLPKINGNNIMEFPEIYCFLAAGVLECCMQLGLIPTNANYRNFLRITSIPFQITDQNENVIYKSEAAEVLTEEQLQAPDGSRAGEHEILRKITVSGGSGIWMTDVSELDRLEKELSETKEQLQEETELIRLKNELREKQAKIEQRTAVYNDIAEAVKAQSEEITQIADMAANTTDPDKRDRCRRHIVLLAAYIKRYSNLMLLSSETGSIDAADLALSVSEVLRYLNLYGIPAELVCSANGALEAEKALAVFEAFEMLTEEHLPEAQGIFVNLSMQMTGLIFKMTIENNLTYISDSIRARLASAGVRMEFEQEDNTGYYSFLIEEGGGSA